ncbi:Uncharacterised protein [Legionella donaldsonii]|uniref:Uncharacterized protein n=1 Tax=Legionella donaldsonii TaxID=45060 RepID=A0A378J6D9_9GAMM|nr:hypothetical protein [Legionella donaldsonii]STX43343.1 Uncharacterised protein [Legionella donaldsonii]
MRSKYINAGMETARESYKGAQQSITLTGTMKQVANVASGKAVIDAIERHVPPVNQGLKLFAKGVELPAKVIAKPLVSAAFSFAIRRSVRGAVKSYYVHSISHTVVSSVVQYGLSFLSEEASKSGIADSISNFALGIAEEEFIKHASAKILELLEPLIRSGADLIAAETGRIAKNSVKVYFGNLLLLYIASLILSLLHDDTAGMLRTTVNYAQDLDNGWYCLLVVMMTMAAHLLPVVGRAISPTLQKQHTKSDLKEYIFLKSQREGGKESDSALYKYVVGIVVDTLVDSNLIDSNQIQLALNSIQLGERAARATFGS